LYIINFSIGEIVPCWNIVHNNNNNNNNWKYDLELIYSKDKPFVTH
jgi:hypothetical protein